MTWIAFYWAENRKKSAGKNKGLPKILTWHKKLPG
jgi:hypothetical protein